MPAVGFVEQQELRRRSLVPAISAGVCSRKTTAVPTHFRAAESGKLDHSMARQRASCSWLENAFELQRIARQARLQPRVHADRTFFQKPSCARINGYSERFG